MRTISKLNLWQTLLFFGIPGISIALLFEWALEPLLNAGLSMFWSVYVVLWGPILLMAALVLILWQRSGSRFSDFFAAAPLSWRTIGVVLGWFVLVQILETSLGFTRPLLASWPGFAVPAPFPALFAPNFSPEIPLQTFMGISLPGNYSALLLWAVWLVANIGAEELLWRGYALPRMELTFGRWAWLVNGLLWNISIHFFMRWSVLTLMPISLIVPYLCQKHKSWIPGLIIHGLGNALFYVLLIPSVLQ